MITSKSIRRAQRQWDTAARKGLRKRKLRRLAKKISHLFDVLTKENENG